MMRDEHQEFAVVNPGIELSDAAISSWAALLLHVLESEEGNTSRRSTRKTRESNGRLNDGAE